MKVHVRVTKTDIKEGVPESTSYCPIARALERRHPRRTAEVGINGDEVYIYEAARAYIATLPLEACDFIHAFDAGELVEPFAFDMDFERENG